MGAVELRRELAAVLPEHHPFIQKVDRFLKDDPEEAEYDPNASYTLDLLTSVVDCIDDWKRGIRDWKEVEEALVLARDEVNHKETA